MEHREQNEAGRLLKFLTTWGPILVILVSGIMAWTTLKITVQDLGARVSTVEAATAAQASAQSDIKAQLSQIQTDLLWVKADLQGKIPNSPNQDVKN